jgi:hypothetical protein
MSVSLYYLRKFGLSLPLAISLAIDDVEFLDLFLEDNPKLTNIFSSGKIKKLRDYFINSLPCLSKSTDIFDDVCMLECVDCEGKDDYYKGIRLKIFKKTQSISEFNRLFETVDWEKEGLLDSSKKLKKKISEYYKILGKTEKQLEVLKWRNFAYFLNNTFVNNSEIETLGLDKQILQILIADGFLQLDKNGEYTMLAIDSLFFPEVLINTFNLNKNFYDLNKISNQDESQDESQDDKQIDMELVTLEDFLKSDFKNKDYLILRLQGKKLQEIGDVFGVTRERARQVLNKIVRKMPHINEIERYRDFFTNYRISKDLFINVFCSNEYVYELLSLLYKKGTESLESDILEGKFDEDAKQFLLDSSGTYLLKNNRKKLSREYIIIDILQRNKNLQKYFSLDDIFYLYTEEVGNNEKLKIKSTRSLSALLDRYSNIIFSFREGYRFHGIDYNNEIRQKLVEVFDLIADGAYDMNWIYEKNPVLMKELDILNGYELHFFCKKYKILSNTVALGRNPGFVKGKLTKREYILLELKKFNGSSLDEFINYMVRNYGFNGDTLIAYVLSEFTNHIQNRVVYFEQDQYYTQVSVLKDSLRDEIYEKNEFYSIVKRNLNLNEVNSELVLNLGFVEKGGIVVKQKYRSGMEAFTTYILSHKIFHVGDKPIFKTNEYYSSIQRLESELKILKVSDTSYINVEHLENRGFDKEKLLQFISRVIDFTSDGEYFSIISLINKGFSDSLLEDGFELISLDRLISTSDEVKAVSVGFPNIYCRSKTKKNLNEFLIDELLKCESANLEDFTDDINSKYGLNLDEYSVRVKLVEEGAYYSDILNKAYILKEEYLDEVYGK